MPILDKDEDSARTIEVMEMTDTYTGYASDGDIRHASSSGGVTTAVVSYLFQTGRIQTMIGCHFDKERCRYVPRLVYSYDDYELVGSVYQEMDVIGFIRDNIHAVRGSALVICAPCQVKAIRSILNKAAIQSVIVDYFCSGQTTIEGTYCYYKFLGIDKGNVENIRYRGNGWPNGIEITLNNGEVVKKPNYTEPWRTIHESGLFRPRRCHFCKLAESADADISVGDPWLKEYTEDKVGHTLFLVHTEQGRQLIHSMRESGVVEAERVDYSLFERSQRPNLAKEERVKSNKRAIDWSLRLMGKPKYFSRATRDVSHMRRHIKLMHRLYQINATLNRNIIESCIKLANKLIVKIKRGGG